MLRNMDYNIAAVFLLLLEYVFFRIKYNNNTKSGRYFRYMILSVLITVLLNIAAEGLLLGRSYVPVVLIYIVYSIYFGFVVCSAFIMCEYTRELNPDHANFKLSDALNHSLLTVHILICILNIPLHLYCVVQKEGPMERGPLYIVMYLISFYFLIFAAVRMAVNYSKIKKDMFWAAGTFIVLTCVGAFIQYFLMKDTVIIYFLYAIATFVLLFAFETPDFEKLIITSSELEKSQAELTKTKDREDELSATIRQLTKMSSWSIYFTEDGQVERADWSPEFVHMMGYEDGEYKGEIAYLWSDSLYPDDKEMAMSAFAAGFEGKPYKVEARLVDKKGDIKWYECSGELKKDENGKIKSYQGFIRNIDDEKRIRILNEEKIKALDELEKSQEELKKALFAAEEASRAKTEFLSNMSHDIRTPMNAIVGFTQLARENSKDTEKVEDCLNNIKSSGDHLLNLINDVLDMSRIESGKVRINEEAGDLNVIMSDIENMTHANVEEKGQEYSTIIEDVNDPCVLCDRLRLNQILINCIGNAIKYTQAGGHITVKLSQKASEKEGCCDYVFSVKDDGIGMTPECLAKVFEPFERDKDSRVGQIQGTGLGMAITRNLVNMMGGKIEVFSEVNKGSEFVITIPFKTISRESFEQFGKEEDNGIPPEKMAEALQGKKLLVVDDNKVNRTIAKSLLKSRGMIVEECESGEQAIKRLNAAEDNEFALVLMDIQMPVMNGFEATDVIRSSQRGYLKNLIIIAMTANAFEEDKQKEKEHKMNGHVTKPFKIDELVKEIYSQLYAASQV